MKQINILIIIALLIITSCSTEINIEKYININSPLTLTIEKRNEQTELSERKIINIEPNSEKFKELINWYKNNTNNWKITYATYISKVCVTQNNFRLLYNQNSVVIGFTDDKGNSQQYSKTIKNGELNFLISDL